MAITWILVANGRRARFFQSDTATNRLYEVADFIDPRAATGNRQACVKAKGHGKTAHSGTQFEPRTQGIEKYRRNFAHQLADFVNQGVSEHRCDEVALVASSSMLGAIKPLLSSVAADALRCSIVSDLTRYHGEQLKTRIFEAIRRPE